MTDLTQIQSGQTWRNKHTGKTTTILEVVPIKRNDPTRFAQDPRTGQILFGGHESKNVVEVRYSNAIKSPSVPRFNRSDFDSFLKHWERISS